MAQLKKYLFDRDFGMPRLHHEAEVAETVVIEEPPPPPPPPSFSEEELEAARVAAYAEGRESGLRDSATAAERRQADALSAIAEGLRQLVAAHQAAEDRRQREAMELALAALRRLHPELARREGLDEIAGVVRECLLRLDGVVRVTVRVNPDQIEAVRGEAGRVAEETAFPGKLLFTPDAHLGVGDCRVEWGNGGAERDQKQLWAEIDAIIARAFPPQAAAAAVESAATQ